MAKYDVNYSCGHSGEIVLLGPMKGRFETIEWKETNHVCPDCYEKQQNEKTATKLIESGLPNLQGSEKQIAWAIKIRFQMLNLLIEPINELVCGLSKSAPNWQFPPIMQIEEQVVLIGEDGVFETLRTMAQTNKINEGHIRAVVGTINKLHTFKTTTSAKWIIDNRINSN